MKNLLIATVALACIYACSNSTKSTPDSRTYETSYSSSSIETAKEEENPYLDNSLQTGDMPYGNGSLSGSASTICVSTSSTSECDVVVIVKHKGRMVRNAYIAAGESHTFSVPNGIYQVFFYGGKGWNPNKSMKGGYTGGFVAKESFSKDSEVSLNYQDLEYELIPQQNGNFSTQQSDESEVF